MQSQQRQERSELVLGVLGGDRETRAGAAGRLTELGYRVVEAASAEDLLTRRGHRPDAILYHPAANGGSWRDGLRTAIGGAADIPVIFVSKRRDPDEATEILRLGAADYVTISLDTDRFRRSLESAIESSRPQTPSPEPAAPVTVPTADPPSNQAFITASPQMQALRKTAKRLADSDVTVLIRGESGVGKEVLAQYIHDHSNRAGGPFVKVNCAALPEQLLESELFGFEQGAFTGAVSSRQGKFELAHGGTILLDEIAEMRVSLQAKLLHVLQDGVFTRLGGREEIRANVRVLSATNRNLEKEIETGTFREDLYFRLKVIDLVVPALRERREDIMPLIHHFLELYSNQYARPIPDLSYHLMQRLVAHPWPGNVRELSNLMKGLVILNSADWSIDQLERSRRDIAQIGNGASHVTVPSSATALVAPGVDGEAALATPSEAPASETATPDHSGFRGLPRHERPSLIEVGKKAARAAERSLILETLDETRWNRRKAASLLKVSYKTLLNKIKEHGLAEPDSSG